MADYWMQWPFLLQLEIAQRREEGCDVGPFEQRVAAVGATTPMAEINTLYDELSALQPRPDFPYVEPSELEAIRQERPAGPRRLDLNLSEAALEDRWLGAWLGRCAGCTLGKPVEGWTREQIRGYLELAGEYPLRDYMPLLDPLPAGYQLHPSYIESVRGRIQGMSRDDDTDYTILGLYILDQFGPKFTTQNVADTWLTGLPYQMVYTAERVAYRNLVNDVAPPQSASFRNPFREWIGAQIRADGFGYAAAGLPEVAAELAFRDAALSHVKNGIYGEMFVAAMLAAAFATDDVRQVIAIGLSEIPARSRLAEALRQVVTWSERYNTWEGAWEEVKRAFDSYFWVHTINNAALVLLGLLYGRGDLEQSIAIAVMGGWDTDCNGATVGSIVGAMRGAKALPEKWIGPLNDHIRSCVIGYDNSRISDLARRTAAVARQVRENPTVVK